MENKYINKWSNIINEAKKSLENYDFVSYNRLMEEAKNVVLNFDRDCQLTYECKNFGITNYIFEDALPSLFKSNKSAVKDFVKTIKEDKNLSTQFNFYKALGRNTKSENAKEYINESLSLAMENINQKTINESNKKLAKILMKYNIKPNDFISEENIKLFEACDYVLTHKKRLSNLNEHNENLNVILEHCMANVTNKVNENKMNLDSLVEDFNRKYSSLLNEEEKSFVKELMDFKSPHNEMKKESIFSKFKNECIAEVNKLIESANDEEREGLNAIKNQITDKSYDSNTVVTDLAKLLEIRDILMSE